MAQRQEDESYISQAKATALIVIALLAGFWAGYFYRGQSAGLVASSRASAASEPHEHQGASNQPFGQHDLQVHLAVLKKDPRNHDALVQVGNIYYDSQRYNEAIAYYTKALEVDPKDVNVRTDMATAYWYQGNAPEAVRQLQASLEVRPAHPQTLFNLGIVRLHGLNDAEGAVAAWEKLLATNPGYPEAEKVRGQLEQARALLKAKNSTR